jgi:hypothetical protein
MSTTPDHAAHSGPRTRYTASPIWEIASMLFAVPTAMTPRDTPSTIAQPETGSCGAQHRSESNPTYAGEENLEEIPQPR